MECIDRVTVLGVRVARLERDAALAAIAALHDRERPAHVAYVNAHALNLAVADLGYREVLRRADLVLNDGIGLALAARLKGTRFPANLNGSDLNPAILELAARRGWPVFLLGAVAGVAEETARRMTARYPALRVVGTMHGYAPANEAVAAVKRSGASLLMVAMGNPTQEFFIDRHLAATGARLGIGVGAFFDFTAGTKARAPAWMNRAGIEWLWRLAHEPRRLWRRYVLGNPQFLARVVAERLSGDRHD